MAASVTRATLTSPALANTNIGWSSSSFRVLCKAKVEIDVQKLKQRIIKRGFQPTPKLIYRLRKKEIQKANRKAKKNPNLEPSKHVKKLLEEEALMNEAASEFETLMSAAGVLNTFRKAKKSTTSSQSIAWGRCQAKGKGTASDLADFRRKIEKRGESVFEDLHWLLEDDLGAEDESNKKLTSKTSKHVRERPPIDEEQQIRWLTERLNNSSPEMPTWQLSKLMHAARMKFTDGRLVRIIQDLGDMGNWRKAIDVVNWAHNRRHYKFCKGRYVYTTLLSVLGKARRPVEALNVFYAMLEHVSSYPDMPAYHSIAVILGQAGYLKELFSVIDCLRTGSSKLLNNVKFLWKYQLEPDIVVYNAVLNACVPCQQWEGVFWVLEQMRQHGIKPTSATYGLAMEVMLSSGKYELVENFFKKMEDVGLLPNASTYRILVRLFRKQHRIDEAVAAVAQMEHRGIVGSGSVYYELACCLCSAGKWQEALLQVDKLRKFPFKKGLNIVFTGMIKSCAEAGLVRDCTSIFTYMQNFCSPNIGTINAMIHTYGHNNMFHEAKELFEGLKKGWTGRQNPIRTNGSLTADYFTYNLMLEASALARDWDYLETVYRQMILRGHPIDQRRHMWLIVAASKAGKYHLLDHAFDQLLERGEVPNVSLYKEKILHGLQAHEYAKVIIYIKNMNQQTVAMTQKEWSVFFEKSNDRITRKRLFSLFSEINNLTDDEKAGNLSLKTLLASLKDLAEFTQSVTSKDEAEQESDPCDDIPTSRDHVIKEGSNLQSNCTSLNQAVETDILEPMLVNTINDFSSPILEPSLPSPADILREWRDSEKHMVSE
eukprot:TRINITY_DN4208_c0_g1_i2.p1 TRINITY_DN4208_c0_g1~~TRINITY_DN4208_c0_g1_i2.p1  ORF type:complete len:826 (-),score=151.81 TRINITY_DN4208_c0_g1_i2:256-2733(-)